MSLIKKYKKNTDGGFAVSFSIFSTILILAIAVSVEWGRMSAMQAQLQNLADGAALAGAVATQNETKDRKKIVKAFVEVNGGTYLSELIDNPKIVFDDDNGKVHVDLNASFNTFFIPFFGKKAIDIASTSSASYAIDEFHPVSIAFALDVSGSMGSPTTDGQIKIDVLKDSITGLFDTIETSSQDAKGLKDVIRTGMSAYNTAMVSEYPMSEGWLNLEFSVDDLIANGGTNSVPALQNSYDQLQGDRIYRTAKGQDISKLREYVIFMTDGDNNQPEWDDESIQICKDMRAENIEVFSIAFNAPSNGQLMLIDCASFNDQQKNKGNNGNSGNGNNGNGNGNSGPGNNNNYDPSKCMGNGSKGKGKALGHCDKSDYYFDAEDAEAFLAAFEKIGADITESYIRLTN